MGTKFPQARDDLWFEVKDTISKIISDVQDLAVITRRIVLEVKVRTYRCKNRSILKSFIKVKNISKERHRGLGNCQKFHNRTNLLRITYQMYQRSESDDYSSEDRMFFGRYYRNIIVKIVSGKKKKKTLKNCQKNCIET